MAGTRNSPMKPSVDPAMTTNDDVASKRRKIDDSAEEAEAVNSSTAVAVAPAATVAASTTTTTSAANMETIDVANMLGVKPGDRIEVKWNINEEEDEEDAPPPTAANNNNAVEGERLGLPKTEGEDEPEALPLKSTTDEKEQGGDNSNNIDSATANTSNINSNASSPAPPGMISVWWKATIQKATGQYHILDDADEAVQRNDDSSFKAVVQPQIAGGDSITTSTDKNQTYNCPKCTKLNMSKQGLYTHYGMVHGGKLSRDYPNLLSNQQLQELSSNNNNNGATAAAASATSAMPKVRIPIYEIIYDPLPSLGFPEYSHEEVAFISNVTLLNLSSEEMMNFRKEGEVHSPDVVVGVDGTEEVVKGETEDVGGELTSIFATAASKPPPPPSTNPNDIYKEFRSEDDIRSYMNELMQKSMISTGMNEKMKVLPRSQQNVIAGRINKALEGLLGKMMEEVGKVEGGGQRVVTAEVVKRCMEQMRPV